MHFLYLLSLFFIVLAGAIFNGKFITDQRFEIISRHKDDKIKGKNSILVICLITGTVAIGYILIGMLSGTLDRGTGYLQLAGRFWRPDTFFSAVIRLREIFFVLLPTCIALFSKNKIGTSLACIITTSALAISMVLGGRGLLIFPLILLTGGLWLAKIGPRAMRMMVVIIASFSLLFITVLGQVRSSAAFQSSSAMNPIERIMLIAKSTRTFSPTFDNQAIRNLGFALYTHSDPYLFTAKSRAATPAGTQGLENLKYLWVPEFLKLRGQKSMMGIS